MNARGALGGLVFLLAAHAAALASESVSVLRNDSVSNPRQPQAAVDEEGTIYVAFGAGESVYVSKSTDGGKTYSDPARIGNVAELALGMRRGPRVVAGRETVVVSAIGHKEGNLLVWRSSDGGKTWSGVHVSFCVGPELAGKINRRFCGLCGKLRHWRGRGNPYNPFG